MFLRLIALINEINKSEFCIIKSQIRIRPELKTYRLPFIIIFKFIRKIYHILVWDIDLIISKPLKSSYYEFFFVINKITKCSNASVGLKNNV